MGRLSMLRPAWVEVDLDAICDNVRVMRSRLGRGSSIMAIVKADGYGHGAVETARAALEAGAAGLGVAMLQEALELRRAGIDAPVLVLGFTPGEQAAEVVAAGVTQAVWTAEAVRAMVRASEVVGRPALMHVKIDSGMGRIGARPGRELDEVVEVFRAYGIRRVEGAFTHFSSADSDPAYTERQFATFMSAVDQMKARGLEPGILHCCGSAGLIRYPAYHLGAVRPGIVLYGYPPVAADGYRTALSLKARISHIKVVSAGDSISYGRTYVADRPLKVGTVPLGYADGYRRQLSNQGTVAVRGVRARILGRVCMDQFMVDLSEAGDVSTGETVTVISADPDHGPTAGDIAAASGTIVNDILTGLSPRLPRVYHHRGVWYTLGKDNARIEIERDL